MLKIPRHRLHRLRNNSKIKFIICSFTLIMFVLLFLFIDNDSHKIPSASIQKTLYSDNQNLYEQCLDRTEYFENKYCFVFEKKYIKNINFYQGSLLSNFLFLTIGLNQAGGLTIGNNIFIAKEEYLDNRHLITHELTHTGQYKNGGAAKFVLIYISSYLKNGYENIPYELEAETYAQILNKK
jgi:hypothetical protein